MGAIYLSAYETPTGLQLSAAPPSAGPDADPNRRNRAHKQRALQAPTANYVSQGSSAFWMAGSATLDGAPVFTFWDIPRMYRDPQVVFISSLWRAPFQKAEFTVKAGGTGSDATDAKCGAFVQTTIKRFFRTSLPPILSRFFKYGFAPGGAEFEARDGWLRLSRVRAVENRDAQPRVFRDGPKKNQFAGFHLTNSGSDATFVGWPHAFWFAGHMEFGQFYDRPPIMGMFEPWLEKNTRGGAKQMRRIYFRKHAGHGAVLHYPEGKSALGDGDAAPSLDNQDLARQLLDYADSTSTFVFQNTMNPGSNGQLYDWDIEFPEATAGIDGFLDYPKALDEEMVKGAGIPLEVIQGSDSGSGYKGRLVSYGGFLGVVDEYINLIVEACNSWLAPLVRLNYGPEAWYEIEPVSLATIAAEEEKRNPTGSSAIGQPLPGLPGDGSKAGGEDGASPLQLSTLAAPAPANPALGSILEMAGTLLSAAVKALNPPAPAVAVVESKPVAKPAPHKFGCALIEAPADIAAKVRAVAAKIPDAALGEDGREDEPHITARFGLHSFDAAPVKKVCAGVQPFEVKVGKCGVFRGADRGKPYDVLKFEVESAALRDFHRELGTLPHTDTHKSYSPHLTVAYVKAGMGDALAAFIEPLDATFEVTECVYSDPQKQKARIPLGRPVELSAVVGPDSASPEAKKDALNRTQQKLMRSRKSTIAQLLALAMVKKQQEATAAGEPGAAAGSLSQLSILAGDPMQVARIIGMDVKDDGGTEMSAADWTELELGWSQFTTKSKNIGAVSDTLVDERGKPKRLYGEAARKALERQGRGGQTEKQFTRAQAKRTADALVAKAQAGTATAEDLGTFAQTLPNMSNKDLLGLRQILSFNLRGERKKAWMVERILDHVDQEVGAETPLRAPDKSRNPSKPKPGKWAGTVTGLVSDFGGIDPNSAALKRHYESWQDAVEDGIPLAAFRAKDGARGRNGLEQLSLELAEKNNVTVPAGADAEEHLLAMLKKGTDGKVNGAEGDAGEKQLAEWEKRFADEPGTNVEPEAKAEPSEEDFAKWWASDSDAPAPAPKVESPVSKAEPAPELRGAAEPAPAPAPEPKAEEPVEPKTNLHPGPEEQKKALADMVALAGDPAALRSGIAELNKSGGFLALHDAIDGALKGQYGKAAEKALDAVYRDPTFYKANGVEQYARRVEALAPHLAPKQAEPESPKEEPRGAAEPAPAPKPETVTDAVAEQLDKPTPPTAPATPPTAPPSKGDRLRSAAKKGAGAKAPPHPVEAAPEPAPAAPKSKSADLEAEADKLLKQAGATPAPASEPPKEKRGRGNKSGKSNEVAESRAALAKAGIDPKGMKDKEAVELSRKFSHAVNGALRLLTTAADNANDRRRDDAVDIARSGLAALPEQYRPLVADAAKKLHAELPKERRADDDLDPALANAFGRQQPTESGGDEEPEVRETPEQVDAAKTAAQRVNVLRERVNPLKAAYQAYQKQGAEKTQRGLKAKAELDAAQAELTAALDAEKAVKSASTESPPPEKPTTAQAARAELARLRSKRDRLTKMTPKQLAELKVEKDRRIPSLDEINAAAADVKRLEQEELNKRVAANRAARDSGRAPAPVATAANSAALRTPPQPAPEYPVPAPEKPTPKAKVRGAAEPKKAKAEKVPKHVADLTKYAAGVKDAGAKGLIDDALFNYGDDTPAALAKGLGGYVEETVQGTDGKAQPREQKPETVEQVLKALQKLGAKPATTKKTAKFSNAEYQPLEAAFPGDEVQVVRPPLKIGDTVVYKGVAKVKGKKK